MIARAISAVAACVAGSLLSACGSPIVGAECRPGYIVCDGRCVDPERDPEHCGGCGRSCGAFDCRAAACSDEARDGGASDGGASGDADAASLDAGPDAGGVRPPGQTSGGVGSPFRPDGGLDFPDDAVMSGCSLGTAACGGDCVDLQSDRDHCGACGTACPADEFCFAGTCVDQCDPPLSACHGGCVDLAADWRNCGSCGHVCASGLCEDGVCADAFPGHLVVIGHDYASAANPTMRRIAGNALFLARGAPVRTLVYTGAARSASIAGITAAFDAVVAADGRQWTPIAADPELVSAQLAAADAFVIHAQRGAEDSELRALGQRWGLSLAQFLVRGGVVVLFETQTGANAGTYQILDPAGLFRARARSQVPARTRLRVVGSPVSVRATPEYQSQDVTTHFLDVDSEHTPAVLDPDGEIVVAHRAVSP